MNRHATLTEKVEQYVIHRRSLGFQFRKEEWLLQNFAAFAESLTHQGPLTVELAMRWVCAPTNGSVSYRTIRLTAVRGFAQYLAISEPGTEIPPSGVLGPVRRHQPYIYSEGEILALIASAQQLTPVDGLRPKTYATLIGLLACTGLRISEALRLTRSDFDERQNLLTIRETKFYKSRLVPLHPSATTALRTYAVHRDRLVPSQAEQFFITDRGTALRYGTVHRAFHKLCIGLETAKKDQQQRRIHDLRHTFACRRLQRWYEMGVDVAHAVTALSVYLGHTKVGNTYWYLTATPELLESAAARFEPFAHFTDKEA